MSAEFFSTMTRINQIVDDIKFLEGSHPELYKKYYDEANEILENLDRMHSKIQEDLKKKAKKVKPNNKRKK